MSGGLLPRDKMRNSVRVCQFKPLYCRYTNMVKSGNQKYTSKPESRFISSSTLTLTDPKKRPDTDTEEPHQAASHSCQDPWPKKYFLFQKVSRVSLFEGNVLEESPIKSS